MTELFTNVRDEVKEVADMAWRLAISQKNPINAAEFLNNTTNYYKNIFTEEEIEFLQFYFNMKMEMIKNG
jgi:hypothetical protein